MQESSAKTYLFLSIHVIIKRGHITVKRARRYEHTEISSLHPLTVLTWLYSIYNANSDCVLYLGQLSSASTRLSQLLSLPLLTRLHSEMSSPPSAPTYCFNSDGAVVSDSDLLSASDMSSASSRLNETLSPTLCDSAPLSAISLALSAANTLPANSY